MVIRQAPRRHEGDDWSAYAGRAMEVDAFLALDDAEETDLEYIDGVVQEKAVVDRTHRNLAHELDGALYVYRKQHGGEAGPEGRVRLGPRRYVKPDVAYYAPGTDAGTDALPTLVIEIRSRSETLASQRRKCALYAEAGVPETWLVDPVARRLTVFRPGEAAVTFAPPATLTTPLRPGFALALEELFAAAGE